MNWNDPQDPWWNDAVAEFGRTLGFRGLGEEGAQVHNFVVGNGKYLLDIECAEQEVVLAVFREAPLRQETEKMLALLRRCSYASYLPFLVQVALKGDNTLVLAIRLGRSQASEMSRAFEFLCQLYAEAGL